MHNYISYDLAKSFDYLYDGQVVRANHNTKECQGKSNSLQVTRRGNDLFIYCHRCTISRYFKNYFGPYQKNDINVSSNTLPTITLPKDFNRRMGEWPKECYEFLNKVELDEDAINDLNIGYSPTKRRLIFSLWNKYGLSVLLTRRIFEDDKAPKWVTYKNKNNPDYSFILGRNTEVISITEDVISAYKLSSYTCSYPLLTNNITPSKLVYISNNFLRAIVWLDNDNIKVRKNSFKIASKLELLGVKVKIIQDQIDPKNVSYLQLDTKMDNLIRDLLHGTRTT